MKSISWNLAGKKGNQSKPFSGANTKSDYFFIQVKEGGVWVGGRHMVNYKKLGEKLIKLSFTQASISTVVLLRCCRLWFHQSQPIWAKLRNYQIHILKFEGTLQRI